MLTSCPHCATPVRVDRSPTCPHCGASVLTAPSRAPSRLPTTVALALTLGLGSACYGVSMTDKLADTMDTASTVDGDQDGYAPIEGDCDDTNPDVNPGATEVAGDAVDSNCDSEDDT